ncbi:MAG: hypothetical protein ACP5QT_07565 [Brevinematia bacterium]
MSRKSFSGIFFIIFFTIFIIFFIGEQRLELKNNELLLKKIESEIKELEETRQQLILEYNNEYRSFSQRRIDTKSKPISINDIKIIELNTKLKTSQKAKEETSSDFEKIIKFIKNKMG